ncbi:MAG: PPC domain-containing protein [Saprospiraceae bacterium]|nr:PPC domain-containing protein [Saprospiraceae bacterium]
MQSPVPALPAMPTDDVWYSFVAANSTHIITVDGAANMDAVIDLRSGACNGTNIDCSDATTADGIEVITATGLTPAATYYVRVYDYDAGGGDFTICITTPPSPLHYRSKATGNFSTAKTWETSPEITIVPGLPQQKDQMRMILASRFKWAYSYCGCKCNG